MTKNQNCPKCKRETATSIHGRCRECGFQKFPSATLEARHKDK